MTDDKLHWVTKFTSWVVEVRKLRKIRIGFKVSTNPTDTKNNDLLCKI